MRAGSDFLRLRREEGNVEKLEAAVIDRQRDDRFALKLAEASQIFVAVEEYEFLKGKLAVAQYRLDFAAFECRGTNNGSAQGVGFSGTHELEEATSCRQGWERVVPQAR